MSNALSRWFHNPRYNWIGLVVSLAAVLFCFLYAVPAFLSGNALWGLDTISARPIQAILYNRGQTLIYEPGSKKYDLLVKAAYTTIYNQIGVSEAGWSEARFMKARAEGLALELIYNEPVKLPGRRIDISDPSRLFFPLDVYGWTSEVVFRGGERGYWGLPLHIDSLDPLRQAVAKVLAMP
jgi:hypothetical protein